MSKVDTTSDAKKRNAVQQNPFLSNQADDLWNNLKKDGKPILKEELLKRIKEAQSKSVK